MNSDDPAYFGGYVADNYLALAEEAGLSGAEVVTLAENSFLISWVDDDRRAGYLDEIGRYVEGYRALTTGTPNVLIHDGIVLPLDGTRTVHDPGSVLVVDGAIAAVGPPDDVARHPAADSATRVDAAMHAVIPGLHNAHLHSGLLRGTAESMALWEWFENHIDPAHRALTPEIARTASYMAYTEAVLGGTTSVLDMWRFMEGSAQAAADIGIRATLAPYGADRYDYFESLETNRRLLETHLVAADGRVRTWVGLEHIFYCSPEMFRGAAELADEFGTGIHTHSSESIWEVQECLRQFGRRPIEEMYQRGILGSVDRHRPRRLARRPRGRGHGADRHGDDALPVLEHEAVLRCRSHRPLPPARCGRARSARTARRRTTTSTCSRR